MGMTVSEQLEVATLAGERIRIRASCTVKHAAGCGTRDEYGSVKAFLLNGGGSERECIASITVGNLDDAEAYFHLLRDTYRKTDTILAGRQNASGRNKK